MRTLKSLFAFSSSQILGLIINSPLTSSGYSNGGPLTLLVSLYCPVNITPTFKRVDAFSCLSNKSTPLELIYNHELVKYCRHDPFTREDSELIKDHLLNNPLSIDAPATKADAEMYKLILDTLGFDIPAEELLQM